MAAAGMRASAATIATARDGGAAIFAVCAGFQLLGTTYEAGDGDILDGLGLLDLATRAGEGRLIGECLVVPEPTTGLSVLTGFENHGGRTTLGPGVAPLGHVTAGHGNGVDGVDGVLAERVLGTYLHGPVLPRNPTLADHLLAWVLGREQLTPLDDSLVDALRGERLEDAARTGMAARLRDWRLNRG
jgi:CobQ-like glutamine amidotransferase family enzyme